MRRDAMRDVDEAALHRGGTMRRRSRPMDCTAAGHGFLLHTPVAVTVTHGWMAAQVQVQVQVQAHQKASVAVPTPVPTSNIPHTPCQRFHALSAHQLRVPEQTKLCNGILRMLMPAASLSALAPNGSICLRLCCKCQSQPPHQIPRIRAINTSAPSCNPP